MESKHDNLLGNEHSGPLYSQIQQKILQALEQGFWQPGDLIPSEFELATKFEVSQGTVRKAIDELVARHILIRKQGSGTFVATHQEERSKYRFLHIVNSDGLIEDSSNTILGCTQQKVPLLVQGVFSLGEDDSVIHIQRLMSFRDKPVVLEDIWLPIQFFEGLHLDLLKSWSGTMYGLFENHFGIHMVKAHEQIRAVLASETTQKFLDVNSGTPVLEIFRIAFTYGDRAVEVRKAQCLTEDYHYFNLLS
jgi:GntR family transcriptional regulator